MFTCAACSFAIESTQQTISCSHCAIRLVWADVYALAVAKVTASNGVHARDLVHEVIVELLRPRASGVPRRLKLESLASFIASIARRRHIDHGRRDRRVEHRDDIDDVIEGESFSQDVAKREDHTREGRGTQLKCMLQGLAQESGDVSVIARALLDDEDFEPSVRRLAVHFSWSHHRSYVARKEFAARVRRELEEGL
ncbi:MAG: sigma-70 family RNA polymerase sigma factor [Myxococcales bacterium]|nr:sigma-70 family RNA polymerase sigma factor [Myxococcales bacterium]